jgi:nicotinate-nucleotide adenylyltransferase
MAERAPGDERFFLVGADASRTFSQWRNPRRIAELARIAVMQRSTDDGEGEGAAMSDEEVRAALEAVVGAEATPPIMLPSRRVDVSSSEIRARVREGRSIHGFVPDAVARFIHERGLYR